MSWPFKSVGIVGLGLMGGSLAKSLKGNRFPGKVCAVDINPSAVVEGMKLGVIDEGSTDYDVLRGCELIVIAVPVLSYPQVCKSLEKVLEGNETISDMGSVKGEVVRICEEKFGGSFVGAHPIAGTEKSGVKNAVLNLFKNAKVIVTPTEKTDKQKQKNVEAFWKMLGAKVVNMTPEFHDVVFAYVSHLPHVVAYTLVSALEKAGSELNVDMFDYTGGGFKDFTRIAKSDPTMWRDICVMNSANVLKAIESFEESLKKLKSLIKEKDEKALRDFFKEAKEARKRAE